MISAGRRAGNIAAKGSISTGSLKSAISTTKTGSAEKAYKAVRSRVKIHSSGAGYVGGRGAYIQQNGSGYSKYSALPKTDYVAPKPNVDLAPSHYMPQHLINKPSIQQVGNVQYNPFR